MTPCEKCQKYDDCRTGTGGGLVWPCGAYAPTAEAPEEKIEIPEAKSLRWLAMNFPFTENPADETDRLCNAIHVYATAGADLIEKLADNLRHNTVEGIVEGIKATMVAASSSGDAISRETALRAFTDDPQPTYTLGQIVSTLDALPAAEGVRG